MLEIIILWKMSIALGRIAAEKNRSTAWAGLGIVFWVGGEVIGFVLMRNAEFFSMWLAALALAALGAFLAFRIVRGLAILPGPDDPIPNARIVER